MAIPQKLIAALVLANRRRRTAEREYAEARADILEAREASEEIEPGMFSLEIRDRASTPRSVPMSVLETILLRHQELLAKIKNSVPKKKTVTYVTPTYSNTGKPVFVGK